MVMDYKQAYIMLVRAIKLLKKDAEQMLKKRDPDIRFEGRLEITNVLLDYTKRLTKGN
jgi:hypothetical protein